MKSKILALLIACSIFVPAAQAEDTKPADAFRCYIAGVEPVKRDRDPIQFIEIGIHYNDEDASGVLSVAHISKSRKVHRRWDQYAKQTNVWADDRSYIQWTGYAFPSRVMSGRLSWHGDQIIYTEAIWENDRLTHRMISLCEKLDFTGIPLN